MPSLLFKITIFAGLLGFVACDQRAPSFATPQDFQKSTILRQELVPMRLKRAGAIPHQFVENQVTSGQYSFDSSFLKIVFPTLSAQEFESLKTTYGSWSATRSNVFYQPNQSWSLSDFLPPLVQASLEFSFLPETRVVSLPSLFEKEQSEKRVDTTVTLLSNCWGTAYEILRSAKNQIPDNSFSIFYAPQHLAREFFFDTERSVEIQSFSSQDSNLQANRNANLQPGDVLLVGNRWLQHVAIFIDDDIYFEKSGSGATSLYRLTSWDTLTKTWPPGLHPFSWRRFHPETIPPPAELFNLKTALPDGVSLHDFTSEEIQRFTVEINKDDSTGKPISATWLERRQESLTFDENGRAHLAATLPLTTP